MRPRFANLLSQKQDEYRGKFCRVMPQPTELFFLEALPVMGGNEQGSGQGLLDAHPTIILLFIW